MSQLVKEAERIEKILFEADTLQPQSIPYLITLLQMLHLEKQTKAAAEYVRGLGAGS